MCTAKFHARAREAAAADQENVNAAGKAPTVMGRKTHRGQTWRRAGQQQGHRQACTGGPQGQAKGFGFDVVGRAAIPWDGSTGAER